MPINKSLWTPSYVVFMAGWANIIFGVFYWLLDAMPLPMARARMARWAHPLVVFGMNALFIFALSGLVAKLLGVLKLGAVLYAPILALGLAPVNASLLFAIGFFGVLLRKNTLVIFMSLELMLVASTLALVAFSRFNGTLDGNVFVFFILTVAAAEVAVGLAIIVALFRQRRTVQVDELNALKH